MVKDTLNSIFDNVKERTTNPFLGTLFVVWCIKNWTLIYSLLYFDSTIKLKGRLDYINDYFSKHSFILNMFFVVLITLGVLLLTYFFLAISRLLADSYERIILPNVSKWTDRSSVVLKTDYVKIQEVVLSLQTRLEVERMAKVQAQEERDASDKKLFDYLNPSSSDVFNDVSPYEKVTKRYMETLSTVDVSQALSNVQSANKIRKNNLAIQALLRDGLVEVKQNDPNDSSIATFVLTAEGREFSRYWHNQN